MVYVGKPESATRGTAKALFWVVLVAVAVPMLACVGLCVLTFVLGAADTPRPS